ncbi:dihydroneopterin aldolase [bacterium]|nr:dihydroneopterin aldolase [bacterium]
MNNMRFYAYHGVSAAEKEIGKHFDVNVEIWADTSKPASTDRLEDTINYEEVYNIIEHFVTTNKFHLVETLTEKLADLLMEKFGVKGLKLQVKKNTPPFPGNLNHIEVEVSRGDTG